MKNCNYPAIAGLLLALFLPSAALRAAELTLEQVLTKMDAVGTDLRSMRADILQKKWTAILEEFDEGEEGQFYFLKEGEDVLLRKDIVEPTKNSLVLKEGKVVFYQPSINQAQKYTLGQHGDKAEFLLLGFGSDKGALEETYEISLIGQETLDENVTYQLELKPKSEKVAAFFTRIILWVDAGLWVPIQQQLVEPTEDFLLIRFDKIELNPKLGKSAFEVKLPKDVDIIGG
jgi:outer membrane lipoprotein-sorting protein